MTTTTLSTYFALLTLACALATIAAIVVCLTAKVTGPASTAGSVRDEIARSGLWLAWLVAATTTAGSLYYSLGAHFEPCELCWYQRICIYPLSLVLLAAALRRDRTVWTYTIPIAAIGAVIATYHTQLQAFPKQTTFCSLNNPCTTRYVWEFGFISLPLMALTAFCFVITMITIAARGAAAPSPRTSSPLPTP
ncbi:MAG: disulfide bond formation protein B [Ilumatobacteraceae bacterium]